MAILTGNKRAEKSHGLVEHEVFWHPTPHLLHFKHPQKLHGRGGRRRGNR